MSVYANGPETATSRGSEWSGMAVLTHRQPDAYLDFHYSTRQLQVFAPGGFTALAAFQWPHSCRSSNMATTVVMHTSRVTPAGSGAAWTRYYGGEKAGI